MKLGVNVDHIATLRQARLKKGQFSSEIEVFPDPIRAAKICQKVGAHSIVMHLREDRRHIQDRDLFRAKKELSMKLNMEMSLAPSVVRIALKLLPNQVTLVPEKRQEQTTESGLDLLKNEKKIARNLELFRKKKISVSLFIDPTTKQIKLAKKLGVEAIELHTGCYAKQIGGAGLEREYRRIKAAADYAQSVGLTTHAGHGLDYQNVGRIALLQNLDELNIGYAIVSRALWVGFDKAVSEMLGLIT